MMNTLTLNHRCDWVTDDPIYINYHDHEWGKPLYDPIRLFELLILEGAQAGLSWLTVLKKRENYRKCFDHFNPEKIANYDASKIASLLKNPGIIRNRRKIEATIINAKAFLQLQNNGQDFSDWIWSVVDGHPIQNHWRSMSEVPSKTEKSDALSLALKKQGFKFVGTTICYAFMQASGMVNDHLTTCFCYPQ